MTDIKKREQTSSQKTNAQNNTVNNCTKPTNSKEIQKPKTCLALYPSQPHTSNK